MKRPATTWARHPAGLFLALLFGYVLSPAPALAACGDHVRVTRDGVTSHLDPVPPPPASPCHGIFCSRQPDPIPLAPPATARLIVRDVWTQLANHHMNADPISAGWLPLDVSGPLFRLTTSIFHPPR